MRQRYVLPAPEVTRFEIPGRMTLFAVRAHTREWFGNRFVCYPLHVKRSRQPDVDPQRARMDDILLVEQWPIERLRPYERNPRKNDPAVPRMVAAIKEFGFRIPIVARSDGQVVDGHLRLKAAFALELATVPVALADNLTDQQIRAFRLLANQSSNWADWDEDLLALELTALRDEEFDLDLTGFDEEELDSIFAATDSELDGPVDEEDVPAPPASPVSQTGDLWILGRHRVLCGDATIAADVKPLMGGKLAHCLWTDPPYGVAYEGAAGTIANDDLAPAAFATFLAAAFGNAAAAVRPGAAAYVCHADTEGLAFRRAFVEAGFKLSGCLIWKKNTLVLGRSDWQWIHEPVLYGWKAGAAHSWYGGRDQTTVLEENKPARNESHPTMKPVALIERMLVNSTKTGHVVLDLFGGSGSTLIACERTARTARLLELDPRFVDVILRRWQEFTGKRAVLDSTGEHFERVAERRAGDLHSVDAAGEMAAVCDESAAQDLAS